MISEGYCRMMARYNRWQNQNLVVAAESLGEAERRRDRGAFFRSIMGTFNHLLWADTVWISRFTKGPKPDTPIGDSPNFTATWAEFLPARATMDARIESWAAELSQSRLDQPLSWYSGAIGRDMTLPMAVCAAHFFNHQTHHRGQIHAMLTAAGAPTNATDLFAMPGIPD